MQSPLAGRSKRPPGVVRTPRSWRRRFSDDQVVAREAGGLVRLPPSSPSRGEAGEVSSGQLRAALAQDGADRSGEVVKTGGWSRRNGTDRAPGARRTMAIHVNARLVHGGGHCKEILMAEYSDFVDSVKRAEGGTQEACACHRHAGLGGAYPVARAHRMHACAGNRFLHARVLRR